MNMIRYILLTYNITTMVLGFPFGFVSSNPYLDEEIILCGPDLPVIAENLCKGQFLDYDQS